jgi:acyl carrier protein
VLHATTDIAKVVKHTAALMKSGSLLILNEATAVRDFATLTFGLTDGWWLYKDAQRRLANSPLLDLRRWRDVLGNAGITKFRAFPHGIAGHPQSVIVGELDEAVEHRRLRGQPSAGAERVVRQLENPATSQERGRGLGVHEASVAEKVSSYSSTEDVIEAQLAIALNLCPADIRRDKRFADYGVDSIIGIDLINAINHRLGTDLRTTVLFDYCTIRDLAAHIRSECASIALPRREAALAAQPEERSLRKILECLAAGELSADRAFSMTTFHSEELAQVSHEL